ncbi:unnamed protein product [Musa banksii]
MITWIADAVTGLSSFCSCLLAQLQLIPESSCTFQMLLKMEFFFPKGSSWVTELHRMCHHLPKLMAATITLLLDMDIDGFDSSLAWRSSIRRRRRPARGPRKSNTKGYHANDGCYKGLILFHLKNHLQKYRSGKQSSKEMTEQSKDGRSRTCRETLDMVGAPAFRGQEVKEALRAQMEVQRLLEQVEIVLKLFVRLLDQVQKHLQIRMDAHQKYIDSLLAKAYKIASEQIASNGFSMTKQEAPDMATRAISSPSLLHLLSMSSVNLHSSTTAATIEGQFFYQYVC